MGDYTASAVAPAYWKLRALPDHPVVLTRIQPDGPFESARYEVSDEAQIVPTLEKIGRGLFKATSYYTAANGEIREAQDYVLIFGPYSILALSKPLGSAIEGALK